MKERSKTGEKESLTSDLISAALEKQLEKQFVQRLKMIPTTDEEQLWQHFIQLPISSALGARFSTIDVCMSLKLCACACVCLCV